jgi:hypothetical protein
MTAYTESQIGEYSQYKDQIETLFNWATTRGLPIPNDPISLYFTHEINWNNQGLTNEEIPEEIKYLKFVTNWDLSCNRLTSIPSVATSKCFDWLNVSRNPDLKFIHYETCIKLVGNILILDDRSKQLPFIMFDGIPDVNAIGENSNQDPCVKGNPDDNGGFYIITGNISL